MLRLLLDDHGSGSQDLFVKIDGTPSRVWVTDTSGLDDFFNLTNEPIFSEKELIRAKRTDVATLIHFCKTC